MVEHVQKLGRAFISLILIASLNGIIACSVKDPVTSRDGMSKEFKSTLQSAASDSYVHNIDIGSDRVLYNRPEIVNWSKMATSKDKKENSKEIKAVCPRKASDSLPLISSDSLEFSKCQPATIIGEAIMKIEMGQNIYEIYRCSPGNSELCHYDNSTGVYRTEYGVQCECTLMKSHGKEGDYWLMLSSYLRLIKESVNVVATEKDNVLIYQTSWLMGMDSDSQQTTKISERKLIMIRQRKGIPVVYATIMVPQEFFDGADDQCNKEQNIEIQFDDINNDGVRDLVISCDGSKMNMYYINKCSAGIFNDGAIDVEQMIGEDTWYGEIGGNNSYSIFAYMKAERYGSSLPEISSTCAK